MYRYYVYGLCFLIPLVMASLPYIGIGYSSFVCWCYLPQKPVWYRLVLSWVPRYCIIITIFSVYGLLYYYVLREFRTLGGVFTTMHKLRQKNGLHPSVLNQKPSFFSLLLYTLVTIKDSVLPKLVLPEQNKLSAQTTSTSSMDPISTRPNLPHESGSPTHADIMSDTDIQAVNLENFRKRQKAIERQMKTIFVYPFAYIFVWLFPFILQCTQFNFEAKHHPIFWLNCLGAFMQPFNGTVDSLVFFYREQPWKYTIMKNFEKEHSGKLDSYAMYGHDLDSVDSYTRKKSFAASFNVDLDQYARWRRVLSKLRLPFMHLPSEQNIARFQNAYFTSRAGTDSEQRGDLQDTGDGDFTALQGKHDFSNFLNGDIGEKDFRLTLDNYSFLQGRRPSAVSSHSKGRDRSDRRNSVASFSNKSTKSVRYGNMDPNIIPENDTYVPDTSISRPGFSSSKVPTPQRSLRSSNADTELDFLEFLRRGPT